MEYPKDTIPIYLFLNGSSTSIYWGLLCAVIGQELISIKGLHN